MLRHFSRNGVFFHIFELGLGYIFENFDQRVPRKAKKVIFWQKNHVFFFFFFFFYFFGQNCSKVLPNSKIWKNRY